MRRGGLKKTEKVFQCGAKLHLMLLGRLQYDGARFDVTPGLSAGVNGDRV